MATRRLLPDPDCTWRVTRYARPVRRIHGVVAIATLLGAPVFAQEQPVIGAARPIVFRLEGVLQARSERTAVGFAVVSLGLLGGKRETLYLAVTQARTIGGDPGVLGKDILDAVRPFEPDLLVRGPGPLLDRLHAAAPGDQVVLEGLVNRAVRTYFLRDVQVTPLEPPTTTTTTSVPPTP
jgi:hypothetical protein